MQKIKLDKSTLAIIISVISLILNLFILIRISNNKPNNLIGIYLNDKTNNTIEIIDSSNCSYNGSKCTYTLNNKDIVFTYDVNDVPDINGLCYAITFDSTTNKEVLKEVACTRKDVINAKLINNGIMINQNNLIYNKIS